MERGRVGTELTYHMLQSFFILRDQLCELVKNSSDSEVTPRTRCFAILLFSAFIDLWLPSRVIIHVVEMCLDA